MSLTPIEVAFIAGGFTVLGALIGAWITYWFALKLSVKNARREAGRRLREAFTSELSILIRKYLSGDGFLTTVNKYLIFRELKDRFKAQPSASGSGIPLGMSSLSVSPQIAHHGTEGATIPRPIAIAQGAKQVRQSIGRGHGSLAG